MYQLLIWVGVLIVVAAFVRWQWGFITGFWQDGGRGQFLVMGMPAVIFLVLGVAALGLAAVNMDNLDSRYENLRQKANESAQRIRDEIIKERTMEGIGNSSSVSQIPEDLKQQLTDVQKQEKIYLEKLISLDNNNDEHKYQLAILAEQRGEEQKAISLLQMIGPFDEPGYWKAHLRLAEYYLREWRKARSVEAKNQYIAGAKKQVDNCLIADESNLRAKQLLALILDQQQQHLQAYEIYKELFDEEPLHYQNLLRLMKLVGRESERRSFLDQASDKFRRMISRSSDNVEDWTTAWEHYIICMNQKRDLPSLKEAENAVKAEIEEYKDPTEIGKRVFLQRKLSLVYSDQAMFMGRNQPLEVQKKQLALLALAVENDSKNERALQWLTMLGTNPELSAEVKKIYDPKFDPNVPWVVYSELGHDALKRDAFEEAIDYFNQAKIKNPRHPHVLNNLAYAMLKAGDRNPEQSLLLIDQAISVLLKQRTRGENFDEEVASFYDTRGVALMALERYEDAASAFEVAFQRRPKDQGILENLIKCYESIGNDRQAETYRRRLQKLQKEELEAPK